MLNENAKLWVDALRSGRFEQTHNYLTRLDDKGEIIGNCCLGVACELAIEAGLDITRTSGRGSHLYGERDNALPIIAEYEWDKKGFSTTHVLPEPVREWLGLQSLSGEFEDPNDDIASSLAEQNDNGATFEEIAQIIESEPEGLFGPSKYNQGFMG